VLGHADHAVRYHTRHHQEPSKLRSKRPPAPPFVCTHPRTHAPTHPHTPTHPRRPSVKPTQINGDVFGLKSETLASTADSTTSAHS
jgi:hypothetical protein